MSDRILLTEEVLLSMDFKKWGRDDMPATVTFDLKFLSLAPLKGRYGYDGNEGYGYHWVKLEENNSLSWRAVFEFKYKDELETFLSCKKL